MATSNNEWLQIYHDNLTGTSQPTALPLSGNVTNATTVTTIASNVSIQEGRVTRPTNTSRRSRTSRRIPTTILDADITNFRALVQQFTGVGVGSTAYMAAPRTVTPRQTKSSYSANSSSFNYYGMASRISPPAVGGYNLEVQQLPHQKYYTMPVEKSGAGGDHQHGFVQRFQDGNQVVNFSGENNSGRMDNPVNTYMF
ncbi:hypothetical protein L2E82_45134 [Cichorium intybus]|uniref:Uncharacterized protein n=1 Tax=Cichorium intybus TaxID=13427 RepID=A0ACB8ZS24_CICIN|nr:hypothetical protein L2E82_45134 [Cichorium intybus]